MVTKTDHVYAAQAVDLSTLPIDARNRVYPTAMDLPLKSRIAISALFREKREVDAVAPYLAGGRAGGRGHHGD